MYEKHHHKYDMSIQQGTLAVPGDDQYHVVVNGEIVLSTRVFELAKIIFEEQREELRITAGDPDPREILQRESAGRDIRSLHAESSSNQASPRRGAACSARGRAQAATAPALLLAVADLIGLLRDGAPDPSPTDHRRKTAPAICGSTRE
jgi:hypothetical protein